MKLRMAQKWEHNINEQSNVLQVWCEKDEMWEDVPIVEEVEDEHINFDSELGETFLDTEL